MVIPHRDSSVRRERLIERRAQSWRRVRSPTEETRPLQSGPKERDDGVAVWISSAWKDAA